MIRVKNVKTVINMWERNEAYNESPPKSDPSWWKVKPKAPESGKRAWM